MRTKLATKLKGKAFDVHQLIITPNSSLQPIRILSLDRWKLRHVLKSLSDQITSIPKEEFFCQLFTPDGTVKNVITRFFSSHIEFRDSTSGDTLVDVPLKCILGWEIKPIPENLKPNFEQGIENSILLNIGQFGPSLLLGTDEISHLMIEIKKIIFNMESHQKLLSQKIQNEVMARGWIIKNGDSIESQMGSFQVTENKVIVASDEDLVIREIPLGGVQGWVFSVRTSPIDHMTITSLDPQRMDLKQLQQLINLVSIKGNVTVPSVGSLGTPTQNYAMKTEDDSGSASEVELGGLSDSGSDEK